MPDHHRVRLSGTNLEHAADHNQRVTLHAIRVGGSLTKIDLARITGLTAPAIANITKRLLSDGLIVEAGRRRGNRGQPPVNLEINPQACYAVGINVDRDHITVVIVDFLGQTVARASREVEFALPSEVQGFFLGCIDELIAAAGIDRDRLVGVGVAKPDDLGVVDLPGRPPAYQAWETVDVAALFTAPLDLPVFVENDAAAAAMGEQQLGLGQRASSFFYILISWALGGGLVVDSNYFRGADGRSGEIGFLSGRGAGPARQVQSFVSLSGLSRPLRDGGFSVVDMLTAEGADPVIEAVMARWIDEAIDWLYEPLVAISCLINPAAVFVGGRLPGIYVDRLAEGLNARLERDATAIPTRARLQRAQLAADAPAVGAAILPFSHFLLPKSGALWKAGEAPEPALAAE